VSNTYSWQLGNLWNIKGLLSGEIVGVKNLLNLNTIPLIDGTFKHVSDTYQWLSQELSQKKIDILADLKAPGGFIDLGFKDLTGTFQGALGGLQTTLGSAVIGLPTGFKELFTEIIPDIETVLGPLLGPFNELLGSFGKIGELAEDPDLAGKIMGLFTKLEKQAEFGEYHDIPHDSMTDPDTAKEEAGKLRRNVLIAQIALHAVGFVVEIFSLGQIDTFSTIAQDVLRAGGWATVAGQIPLIEYRAKLLKPLEYYYNREYTPEIPGMGDLVRFRVREAITQEERHDFQKRIGMLIGSCRALVWAMKWKPKGLLAWNNFGIYSR